MLTPPPSLTPTPTVDVTQTAMVEILLATVQPRTQAQYPSPDGQWRAEVLTYDCTKISAEAVDENAFDLLQVVRLSDQEAFTAATQLQNCGGVGAFGLGGLEWSPDSRFFYFTDAREGVPDGGGMGWNRSVYRFDTTATQAENLGGARFSPDEQKLAAIGYDDVPVDYTADHLTVWDLYGQVLACYAIEAPQDGYAHGTLAWSPGSQELVYIETTCPRSGNCSSWVYRVDLVKNERQLLLEDRQPTFESVEWDQPDRLSLVDANFQTWSYTLSTGQLEPPS